MYRKGLPQITVIVVFIKQVVEKDKMRNFAEVLL